MASDNYKSTWLSPNAYRLTMKERKEAQDEIKSLRQQLDATINVLSAYGIVEIAKGVFCAKPDAQAQEIDRLRQEIHLLRNQLNAAQSGIYRDCYQAVAGAADMLVEENERLKKIEAAARKLIFGVGIDNEIAHEELEELLK